MLNVAEARALPSERSADRFDDVFQRLYPRLLSLALRVIEPADAEDVVQEAFVRLSDHPGVLEQSEDAVAAWMRRVCLNLASNRRRDSGRLRLRLERVGRLEPPDGRVQSDGEHAVLLGEQQDAVRIALAGLPARQRDCLLLRHSGYSYGEIAATLEMAVGSVGVLLARAERAFQGLYRE